MSKIQRSQFQTVVYEHRKQEIVTASLTVFQQRGCFGFRVEDVAECAGIAKGSVYAHFESRTDLLAAALEQLENTIVAEYRKRLLMLPAPAAFTARLSLLAEILLSRRTDCKGGSALFHLPCALKNSGLTPESRLMRDLIVPLLREGQHLGLLDSGIPAQGLAHMFLAILNSLFIREAARDAQAGNQVHWMAVDFFIRGARCEEPFAPRPHSVPVAAE